MLMYVVHKGDDVVAIGTKEEVAGQLGIQLSSLRYLASPGCHRRWLESKRGRMVADKVEVDDPVDASGSVDGEFRVASVAGDGGTANVEAVRDGERVSFPCDAYEAPRVGDAVRVKIEWGEGR